MKRFDNSKEAWLWLSEQYACKPLPSVLGEHNMRGICLALRWMMDHDRVSRARGNAMIAALYARFKPRSPDSTMGDGPFFWPRGEARFERMMACYILAQLTR